MSPSRTVSLFIVVVVVVVVVGDLVVVSILRFLFILLVCMILGKSMVACIRGGGFLSGF